MKKYFMILAVFLLFTAILCGCSNNTTQKSTESSTAQGFSTAAKQPKTNAASEELTEADAKAIALKDANISESDASFIKCELETDDGITYYDIEFTAANQKYDYDIIKATGAIREKSIEPISGGDSSDEISIDKARSIALSDAGFKESDVTFTKSELDTDNNTGIKSYEIDFINGDTKYEYTINAETGAIIEKEAESAYDD